MEEQQPGIGQDRDLSMDELRARMEAEEERREIGGEGGVRVTDKRGQNRPSAPAPEQTVGGEDASEEERQAVRQALADQAAAAEAAAAAEPAMACAAFVVVSIDQTGIMRLHHEGAELMDMVKRGIRADREATGTDISNIAAQLQLMVVGNEVASRVLQAMNMQAQHAMAAARNGGITIPQPVAQGRRP